MNFIRLALTYGILADLITNKYIATYATINSYAHQTPRYIRSNRLLIVIHHCIRTNLKGHIFCGLGCLQGVYLQK